MKTFKQGDKVRLISLDDMPHSESCNWAIAEGLELGKIYTVSDFEEDATKNVVKVGCGLCFFHDAERFELVDIISEPVNALRSLLTEYTAFYNGGHSLTVAQLNEYWNIVNKYQS